MADENPKCRAATDADNPVDQKDLEDEARVLDCVLTQWPTHLQESDICRELGLDDAEYGERDSVARAVVQLYSAGLVLRCEKVVIPTRAALYYRRLGDQAALAL